MESAGVKTADDTTAGRRAPDRRRADRSTAVDRATDPRSFVRPAVIVALLVFVLLAFPSIFSLYYVDAWTQVAIYSIVTLGLGLLVGRVGMVSLGQGAVLALGAWVAARHPVRDRRCRTRSCCSVAGLITMVLGTLVGLPALRMSGLYLALITLMLAGRDHGRADHDQLPQRRQWLHRLQRQHRPHPADPPPGDRDHRPGVLPLLGDRRDPDVPARARAHPRAPGTRVGGDPPERVGGAGGRHQHHLLQAVGVRAGVVRHRRRRRPAGRRASGT